MTGADCWLQLLATFSSAFTEPSLRIFLALATGRVICPGRRKITRLYLLAHPEHGAAHDALHAQVKPLHSSTLWLSCAAAFGVDDFSTAPL